MPVSNQICLALQIGQSHTPKNLFLAARSPPDPNLHVRKDLRPIRQLVCGAANDEYEAHSARQEVAGTNAHILKLLLC